MKKIKNSSRILIRSANWVGDAIMSTPAVSAVRKFFPEAHVAILAKPWVAPVFYNSPHVDEIILYEEQGVLGKVRLGKRLRKGSFDLAILIQNAFEAALITFLAGIPKRLGYDTDARTLLLSHPVHLLPEDKQKHMIDYYLGILGGASISGCDRRLRLFLSDEERARAGEILENNGIKPGEFIVGINPGAAFGTAKRWMPEQYARVAGRFIKEFGCHVAVFGGPGEEDLGKTICSLVGDKSHNFCGKTSLREAMALIGSLSLFITNDSGLMHVAAALGVRQLAIFGSTDHTTTSPAHGKSRIIRVDTECSPCLKQNCPTDHRCMTAITDDMVFDMAKKLLEPLS